MEASARDTAGDLAGVVAAQDTVCEAMEERLTCDAAGEPAGEVDMTWTSNGSVAGEAVCLRECRPFNCNLKSHLFLVVVVDRVPLSGAIGITSDHSPSGCDSSNYCLIWQIKKYG